jgi:hypothetical protein
MFETTMNIASNTTTNSTLQWLILFCNISLTNKNLTPDLINENGCIWTYEFCLHAKLNDNSWFQENLENPNNQTPAPIKNCNFSHQ